MGCVVIFAEGGKLAYPEETLGAGSRTNINSAHIWHHLRDLYLGHTGGGRVLSPSMLSLTCYPYFSQKQTTPLIVYYYPG